MDKDSDPFRPSAHTIHTFYTVLLCYSMAMILQTHVHHMEGLSQHHSHNEEHGHEHAHEAEHEHGDDHGHEHGDEIEHDHANHLNCDGEHLTDTHVQRSKSFKFKKVVKWTKSKLKHTHSHDHNENINLRAALIHCIGDIVQSIGVIIAAYIIRFKVCTSRTN